MNKAGRINAVENFLDSYIESFNSTIEYGKTIDRDSWRKKADWAYWSLETDNEKAFGALLFMHCYTNELTNKKYEELTTKLRKAYFAARDRVRDEYTN